MNGCIEITIKINEIQYLLEYLQDVSKNFSLLNIVVLCKKVLIFYFDDSYK